MDEKKNERLFSLDLLRGLDMFLLTVIGPLWCAVSALWGPFPNWVSRNFGHYWGAFGLWDLIMPMFIFMCGAAIPFALGRRLKDGRPTLAFGWAIYPVIPSIKHIYSLTFTAQAMGWCCLALAALYFLSDVWGVRRGLGLFILFGQHALTAYLVTETLFVGAAMKLVQCFVGGLPNLLGTKQYQILFENLGFAVLLVLVLVAKHRLAEWRRARTFI